MLKKACCAQCGNICLSGDTSGCSIKTNHNFSNIAIEQYFERFIKPALITKGQFVQYHSQTTTPDIRPPII